MTDSLSALPLGKGEIMNVKEFYSLVGGDYEDCLSRIPKEEKIVKFLRMFAGSDEYDNMMKAIEAEDWTTGFRGSHSMKGMCANLGLSKLRESSSELCETMRNGAPTVDIGPLVEEVRKDYEKTVAAIGELD